MERRITMGFKALVNTQYFREAAIDFRNNGGVYTRAPVGSRDYREYWEEQDKRCMEGYKVGDMWIPGRMYDWLNFTPISRVPEHQMLKAIEERKNRKGKISKTDLDKVMEFPAFWEIGWEWWMTKHIAWHGGAFDTSHQRVVSPGNKHICCLKTRGAGFSFMEACDAKFNFKHYPGSKSYFFAGLEDFLIKDGILNKVQPMLDFINDNCEWWKQNRMYRSTLMHQRASFKDSKGMERGTFSEIIGQVVDDANKTRGKRGKKITFEEAGSFKNLKKALAISLGSIREGSLYVGQASVFGTGGEEGPSIEGLEDIWSQPWIYDMVEFVNVWDEDAMHTTCGYFVPHYMADSVFMDAEGNVDKQAAVKHNDKQREKYNKARDFKELDRFKAEYPRNPQEALKRISGNPFRTGLIDKTIRKLETDEYYAGTLRYGMYTSQRDAHGFPVFEIKPISEARPIQTYPHNHLKDEALYGCVTIDEPPWRTKEGTIPVGMYTVVLDSYALDDAEDVSSLFSAHVFKNYNEYDNAGADLPQAWFEGRPESLLTAYDQILWMAEAYNADIQGEIAGGGQAFVNHAKMKGLEHRLKKEPSSASAKDIESRQNSYFMNMTTDRKRVGLTYLIDWHKAPRGINLDGTVVTNVERIKNIRALKELRYFDGKKNADAISAWIVYMFERKQEVIDAMATVTDTPDDFWDREFFQESDLSEMIEAY
jgi:hypothetical protein